MEKNVLSDGAARLAQVRLLARMGGTITDGAAANRPMAHPTGPTPRIPPKPRSRSANAPARRRPHHPRTTSALRPRLHHGPRKTDTGTAGEGPRSTARHHQEEAGRTQQVNTSRCREEGEEEDSVEASGGGPETLIPSAGFSRGCRGGGGEEAMGLSRRGRPMERQPAHKTKNSRD
jgi:hypothetical protein